MASPKKTKTAAAAPSSDSDAFGKPLGATLDALIELGPFGGELFYLVDGSTEGAMITQCREHYNIEVLGRSHDKLAYFGVPRTWDAKTVDQHPIVLVDSKGQRPHVVAENLAQFLGDIAWSPGALGGQTKQEWERAKRETLEDHGELVRTIADKLCSLPGVTMAKAPWLTKKLPVVPLQARPPEAVSAEDIEDVIDEAYTAAFKSLLFHPSPDEVEVNKRGVSIRVALDAPEGTSDALEANAIVAGPLHQFRETLRTKLPGAKVAIELVNDCLSDDVEDAWRRLKIAIVDQAKQPALFQALLAKHGPKR